ncbi:hypothetical protein [Shewanella xiamenensis]|uniref:hypothetical protein n=1 Tax=Shewanella xiamenensis TaxID=332186 RepID=UPI00313CC81B
MANYNVVQYTSRLLDNGHGYMNIFIFSKLRNSSGNSKVFEFRISSDERNPSVEQLKDDLDYGFIYAMNNNLNIKLSVGERNYLWFTLHTQSRTKKQYQVSGVKL